MLDLIDKSQNKSLISLNKDIAPYIVRKNITNPITNSFVSKSLGEIFLHVPQFDFVIFI